MAADPAQAQEQLQAVVQKLEAKQSGENNYQSAGYTYNGDEQSGKRKYSGEDEGPDAKRATTNQPGYNGAMGDSNGLADGGLQYSDTLDCPSQLVGKLIGRRGETVQILENKSEAKIQVDHKAEGDPKKVTIRSNDYQAVQEAKQLILKVINEDFNVNDCKEELDCPPDKVGRIIGRAGETIRTLQKFSNARVQVDQNYPEGVPRKVIFSGKLDAVDRAKKMVHELITEEQGNVLGVIQRHIRGITRTVSCPKPMVGKVIGSKGETIKKMQSELGVIIKINQEVEPCEVSITGVRDNVNNAENEVKNLINPSRGGFMQPPFQDGSGRMSGKPYGGRGNYGGQYQQYPSQGGSYAPYNSYGGQGGYSGYGGYGSQQGYGGGGGGGYQASYYGSGGGSAYAGQGGDSYSQGYGGGTSGGYQHANQGMGSSQMGGGSYAEWAELQDDAGRPYYYNYKTGVSQWEKPPEFGM